MSLEELEWGRFLRGVADWGNMVEVVWDVWNGSRSGSLDNAKRSFLSRVH